MKKFTKITNGNIHLIMFRIKKFIHEKETIAMVAEYPLAKRLSKLDGEHRILRSNVSQLNIHDCNIKLDSEFNEGNKYICVNYQQNTRGFILSVGERIKINSDFICVKSKKLIGNEPCIKYWTAGNKAECERQTKESKLYESDYIENIMNEDQSNYMENFADND